MPIPEGLYRRSKTLEAAGPLLALGVEHHARRALDNLRGKRRALPHLGSILNRRNLLNGRGGSP
jgi:hypothetical protein